MSASSLVSSLGLRRFRFNPVVKDGDYVVAGQDANRAELAAGEGNLLFRLLQEEEGFDGMMDTPFALKQVKDVHAIMRHAVAVAGERQDALTHHPLFHIVFASFALGFSLGLAGAQRCKHVDGRHARLTRAQQDQCDAWGVEAATYYLAVVDAFGIFGKATDIDLYGIADKWRLLGDERKITAFTGLKNCVNRGRRAAELWFDDDTADVPPHFIDALMEFIAAHPRQQLE